MLKKVNGDVRRIETHQVQGRWQKALMPKVFSYQEEELQFSHQLLSGDDDVFMPREHGFSMTIDSIDSLSASDKTKIFGQIGTLQSVSIVESRHEAVELQGSS